MMAGQDTNAIFDRSILGKSEIKKSAVLSHGLNQFMTRIKQTTNQSGEQRLKNTGVKRGIDEISNLKADLTK
jgi:hypothetical protein